MKVVIADTAWVDMLDIGRSILRDNPARAATFVDELYASCVDLGAMPMAYPLVPRHADSGIRRKVHGNYLIFYRVEERYVTVLHVVHGAREYEAILFPSDERG